MLFSNRRTSRRRPHLKKTIALGSKMRTCIIPGICYDRHEADVEGSLRVWVPLALDPIYRGGILILRTRISYRISRRMR